MVWLGMILAMILAQLVQGWSEWGFRVTVLLSLAANLVVALLAGTRRRTAPGGVWGWLGQLAKLFLWAAYQGAEQATTSAIGSLSLSRSDATEEEKQVVAFWAPFLLLHLGGPDNLTAYSLEDNKTSNRKWIGIIFHIFGASYSIFKNTRRSGGRSWALLPAASVFMLIAGAARYWERRDALGKANLDSMQEDASTGTEEDTEQEDVKIKMNLLKSRIERTKRRQGRSLCDGEALLLAQDLFPIWRHALVDSSVNPDSARQQARESILSVSEPSDEWGWNWESMCKVAEMELSLIYEYLYTKAILANTCYYYLIRLLSPLFTAAAAVLFCLWWQHQRQQIRPSFVRITYALLAITLLMDVAWLLRALSSTWAHAYLEEQGPCWLRHQALHTAGRWWRCLHRITVCLDTLWLFCHDPISNRRWSRTIGRYNLLEECTATDTNTTRRSQCPEWWPWSKPGDDRPKEMRYLSKLPQCIEQVLFERVTEILQQAIKKKKGGDEKTMYTRVDIRTRWGHKALRLAAHQGKIKLPQLKKDEDEDHPEAKLFGKEFEEDVLMWHIATCMVLPYIRHKGGRHAWAIEVMSEYMMFLVAVRRQMLPGLVLHSQLQVTHKKLVEIWDGGNRIKNEEKKMSNKDKLAMILRRVRTAEQVAETEWELIDEIKGTEGTRLLALAVELYFYLSHEDPHGAESRAAKPVTDEVLEIIFNVWVDKLVYAAVRCSREAHAEQLSAGGDLTTVLWMLIQHAGPFCMGESKNIYIVRDDKKAEEKKKPEDKKPKGEKKKPEEEKKKREEEEKKKGEKDAPPHLPRPWPPCYPEYLPPPPPPPPLPPCCPVYPSPLPPYYHPPCYDPSWAPVCPWCPQCPLQHEKPGNESEEAREDEHEDSPAADEDSQE